MAAVVGLLLGAVDRDSLRQLPSDRLGDQLCPRAGAAEGRFGFDADVAALLALARRGAGLRVDLGLGHPDAELRRSRTDRRLIDQQAERDLLDSHIPVGAFGGKGLSLAVGFL